MFDLLDARNQGAWNEKVGKNMFNFEKIHTRVITNYEEAYEAVKFAQSCSHYAPTGKNPDSSRGHMVFIIDVEIDAVDPELEGIALSNSDKRHASLLFCDLAGSEGESALGPEFRKEYGATEHKKRRMEAGVINNGLSDLQMIFKELQKNGKLKPASGTGLRRILKKYIKDANTYISVLFCVSPAPANAVSTE